MKYTLKATNIDLTDALREHVDERVNALDKYYDQVIVARIEIGMPSKHHNKGDIFKAEANMQVPGDMLRVETARVDQYRAIDQLTRKMKQALIKYKKKKQ